MRDGYTNKHAAPYETTPIMKQLVLDLGAEQAQSLDTFEVGQNAELAHLMHQFAGRSSREHFAYLWGEASAGKTHLLHALAATPGSRYISGGAAAAADFVYTPDISLYLLDDCGALPAAARGLRGDRPRPCGRMGTSVPGAARRRWFQRFSAPDGTRQTRLHCRAPGWSTLRQRSGLLPRLHVRTV